MSNKEICPETAHSHCVCTFNKMTLPVNCFMQLQGVKSSNCELFKTLIPFDVQKWYSETFNFDNILTQEIMPGAQAGIEFQGAQDQSKHHFT